MKIILCTGDSHTCGQGHDSIQSKHKYKNPNKVYNTAGKGVSRGGDLDCPSYVNLLRSYVAEATGSEYALTNGNAIRAQTGFPLVNLGVKLEGKYTLPMGWQLHTICLMETTTPAELGIFVDGEPIRKETLHTPVPRYNEWSFRNIIVRCKPDQKVTLMPLSGDVHLSHIQHDKGAYAVINSGVGSCTTKRYLEEGWDYCVAEFAPHIVVAEAQTINDWINYTSSQLHGQQLNLMMDRFKELGAQVVFSTVSPIRGHQDSQTCGEDYSVFMDQAKLVGQRKDLVFADSYEAFRKELAPIPQDQQYDALYVDNWHVNARGHKIYADTIFEQLKTLL